MWFDVRFIGVSHTVWPGSSRTAETVVSVFLYLFMGKLYAGLSCCESCVCTMYQFLLRLLRTARGIRFWQDLCLDSESIPPYMILTHVVMVTIDL